MKIKEPHAHILLMIKDSEGKRALFEASHYPDDIPLGFFDYDGPEDPGEEYWVNY